MYCNYPHITIDYGKEAGVIAITGRRKPMFLLFGLDKMLGIQDYSLIFETLEDQDVDTLIDYIDWNASMPFDIISTEGVRKLISISPLPPEEKKAFRNWFENEAIPATDRAWEETLAPRWKVVKTDNWFSGVERVDD